MQNHTNLRISLKTCGPQGPMGAHALPKYMKIHENTVKNRSKPPGTTKNHSKPRKNYAKPYKSSNYIKNMTYEGTCRSKAHENTGKS